MARINFLPVWGAASILRVIALHPLYGKIAEVVEINCTIRRRKVRTLAVTRCGTIGMQPVVSNYCEVFIVNVTIAVKVGVELMIAGLNSVAVRIGW